MNFSGPGVVELARNGQWMPDGGDSRTLYGVGAAWEVTGAGGAVTGAGGAVTGAVGAGVMTVAKHVPWAVNVVLALTVLELPP